MAYRSKAIDILIVEDNTGDFILFEEYLREEMTQARVWHCTTLAETRKALSQKRMDAILLDLSLPDAQGAQLVQDVMALAGTSPVIVLTGYVDKDFGIKTLAFGVSDYLLKDEMNAALLYKSIAYSLEREKVNQQLKLSEQKYRNLFHITPIPMWVTDPDTLHFLDVNEAAVQHYGFSREEFLNMSVHAIRDEDTVTPPETPESMPDSGASRQGEVRHRTKNGDIIIVDLENSQIEFGDRKAQLTLALDITSRLKAEQSLKLSERRFKALVLEGADIISILDTEGKYIYMSPSADTILAIPSNVFIGKSAFDFIHPEDRQLVIDQFNQLARRKRIYIPPFRFGDGGGYWHWVETVLTNLTDDPAVSGIVANSRDVSQHVRFERRLKETNDRYEAVARATRDAIWDYDIENQKIYALGFGYKTLFGYNIVNQFAPDGFLESCLHPDEKGMVQARFVEAMQAPDVRQHALVYRFLKANGEYAYVQNRFSVMYDDQGRPTRMHGAIQDITRQREEELRLRLLESVVTNATDAVLITEAEPLDEPGPRIVYVNEAFMKLTGYDREEVIGRNPRFLQGPQTSRDELDRLKDALRRWEPCEIEIINYKKNGEPFWINIAVAPIADSKGWFTHWISIQRDITERKKMEAEKETLIAELTQNNKDLRQFSYITSHNLRGPIANLMGLSSLIDEMQVTDESLKQVLKGIKKATFMFDDTIRDLMKVLVVKDNPSIQREALKIGDVLEKLLAQMRFLIEEAHAEVTFDFHEAPVVYFNRSYFESILMNLLTNALRYRSGDRFLKVSVTSKEDDDALWLWFKDNGIGIDTALYREKIFGLYQKFHDHPDSKGLGLFLVKSQIESLGGSIDVVSTVGEGTTFILKFRK